MMSLKIIYQCLKNEIDEKENYIQTSEKTYQIYKDVKIVLSNFPWNQSKFEKFENVRTQSNSAIKLASETFKLWKYVMVF